jgi:predicted P-loop ATPase/GTPase
MKVLVAGADRVDAGKTTFSTGLLARLGGVGFKPRAGNDYWFDHDDYLEAVGGGRLYGRDARRLAAASHADLEPEELNPVHRLWRPAPDGDGYIGRAERQFVLDRAGDGWIVNADADVPPTAAEQLPLDDARRVSGVDALNEALAGLALPALDALADRIRATEPAVIESYGDVARPLAALDVDRVAVVDPGRVRVFDGERYLDACEVAGGSPLDGQLEERVPDVIELLQPEAEAELPALTGSDQADPGTVADAYAAAYDTVLGG